MTLGEKILSLRAMHKMSQAELAEKLEVSRQSVSKWETEASIPELDKLILMSELFHVTLDELVRSDSAPETQHNGDREAAQSIPNCQTEHSTKRTVGFLLLGTGILGGILGLLLSQTILLLCLCLIAYGIICLVTKKHTGLICGWLSAALLYAPSWLTGARLPTLGESTTITDLMICLSWLATALMIFLTVKALIKGKKQK